MRTEQSDLILDLLQSAEKVEVEIETHADEVALRLDEWADPLLGEAEDGREKPDFRATLLVLRDGLSDSRGKLNAAEQANIDLIRQVVELREERQELTEGLYEDFSSLRRTVEELYRGKGKDNPNAFVVAGIQGPTSQGPTRLLRQIELATVHLSQPGFVLPASRFGGAPLDPRDLVASLQPRSERLRKVQVEIRRLGSELNASRKEKNRAIERHKNTFSWVSQGAAALFRLAGESELADRIRPAARRARRRGSSPEADAARAADAEGGSSDGGTPTGGSVDAASGEAGPAGSSPDEPSSSEPAVDVAGPNAATAVEP